MDGRQCIVKICMEENCCMSIWNLCPFGIDICPFGMDICQMGICVHSKWTYVYSEWTYVRWEFTSIRNGHMSNWNLCPFRMDMYVRLESSRQSGNNIIKLFY